MTKKVEVLYYWVVDSILVTEKKDEDTINSSNT